MTRPQLFTGLLAASLTIGAACNRAETQDDAREAAAQMRSAAARAGDRLADSWLTAKVQAKFFADDDIKARYIDVATEDGLVTLKGFVESDSVRQEALSIARSTDGVKQVNDQLLIGQAPQTADASTGTGVVGTSGAYPVVPTPAGTVLDDSMVTSLVQAKFFGDPSIKARHIDVQAVNGVVTLRGQVASDNERAQALLLARTTQGVERVEDSLTVDASLAQPSAATASSPAPLSGSTAVTPGTSAAPAPPAPGGASAVGTTGIRTEDATLESALKSKISGDAQLKGTAIEVSARDGVVLLQGRVPDQATKQRAVAVARQTEGVSQVVDRLSVGAKTR